jgi:GNAT superfamily N-acetyltransferase
MSLEIIQATPKDAGIIAAKAKALTDEIIIRTGTKHFNVDLGGTTKLCHDFLLSGTYVVFLAVQDGCRVGLATLCESHALYAEGTFGIVQEFYIEPTSRSAGVGQKMLNTVAAYAKSRGWKRLELCTPPLPEFDRTVHFYEENGFEVTGGRKMKLGW